jgi:hypothetical protein
MADLNQSNKKEIIIMWYHLYIEEPDTALALSRKFMEAVIALIAVSDNNDVAVFSRNDKTEGVHYYFTPPAMAVAVAYGASPCERPSKREAGGLLVGDQTLLGHLF